MPDITTALERAAATPRTEPEIERPLRRQRTRRIATTAVSCCLIVGGTVAVLTSRHREPVRVALGQVPRLQPATHLTSHDASIEIMPGWYASSDPLAWWLHSPFELFSIATSPLPPAPHKAANEAACPSEIPQVAVDAIADDGAYLWIGEWRPHEGEYMPSPRPSMSDGLELQPGCTLPRGEKAYLAVLRDGTHDYSVTFVLGKDAPPSRRDDINKMLDSLRFGS